MAKMKTVTITLSDEDRARLDKINLELEHICNALNGVRLEATEGEQDAPAEAQSG